METPFSAIKPPPPPSNSKSSKSAILSLLTVFLWDLAFHVPVAFCPDSCSFFFSQSMRIDRLPLPDPWTIENLSEYADALISFITTYSAIACFNSSDIFTSGLPLDWTIPEYSLEQWLKIVAGQEPQNAPDPLTDFLRLSRQLPLKDVPNPPKLTHKPRTGASPK